MPQSLAQKGERLRALVDGVVERLADNPLGSASWTLTSMDLKEASEIALEIASGLKTFENYETKGRFT